MKRLLLLTLALAGCIHVNKSVVVDRSDRPVPEDEVQVFFDRDEMPESCQRVAFLHAAASEDFTNERKLVAKFKEEAGKLGANAVKVQEAYGSSSRASSSLFDSGSDREFDAEAFWCPDGTDLAGARDR